MRQTIAQARRRGGLACLLLLGLGLASCSQEATTVPPTPTVTVAPVATVVPATAVPTAIPGGSFRNPVLTADFADPEILNVNGVYYAYATNGSGKNVQLATSSDLIHWEIGYDVMPALARWAKPGGSLVWAPEVIALGGHYVLYYTARDRTSDKQCVGVAVADSPEGKFKDSRDTPLVCQADEGGTIDPSPFRDGDKLYLYFKNDGNCCGITTHLYAQELAPDGLSLLGTPTALVQNDAFWEGRVVEAPTMVKHADHYFLFFSANDYAGADYAVGYATCTGPIGPCSDAPENPILKSRLTKPLVIGPGHQAILTVGDQTWIAYHVWELVGGQRGDRRQMWIDRVSWEDDKPHVHGPTTEPQALPGH